MLRDIGIQQIYARKDRVGYGMGLGVMLLDEVYPGFPGDLRNPSAYPFPIQYEIMEGLNCRNVAWCKGDDEALLPPILKAAKKLERMGCRGILAECGYFAYFQPMVAGTVSVPVFMSSLLQIPFIQQIIGPKKSVGIFCATSGGLSEQHLINVGVDPDSRYHIKGAMDEGGCPQFVSLWDETRRPETPTADYGKAEADIVAKCREYVREYPDIGALMLECTGFQPFARAIQRAVDLPVFSWATLMDYAYSAVAHRDFYGHV
ncbi:aspartate/glutamate racemase family protein [Bacilliculturomica massiliensis]|uniref:aspartate/glutamate racemase family protein n=1 Tax=Bacilliculturomica massiliensis TaxID=1917867 RepID=UPI0010318D54|nr:aspartate/glutamate racemase family protein [Bacilliculturomica massiliensis]